MKKQIWITILMLLTLTLACRLTTLPEPTPTDEPEVSLPTLAPTETATDEPILLAEPTATEDLQPTPEPTPTEPEPTIAPASSGQIAYISGGNLYRYLIDSGETLQVTTDGIPDDYFNSYGRPRFSPDGRYLAYNQGDESTVLNLVDNSSIDLGEYGQFFAWTGEGTQFYGMQGDFACPDIDDLDDQVLINFDILLFDLDDLTNPTHLANIGGGLKFMAAISPDGQWASIVHCGCYSECGSENLWYLPTANPINPPIEVFPGYIDFSSDNSRLTVSMYQLYGYFHSPLYAANIDYSEMTEIFADPDVAPINAQWSPDGEWIAFTGVVLTHDEFVEDDRCVRLVRPDGSQEVIVECSDADFLTWAPGGDQLLFSQQLGTQESLFIYDLSTSSRTELPIQMDPFFGIDWGRLQ